MAAGERGSEGFDIEGLARRLSAGQGEITFVAPLPPQPPGTLLYPQYVCAVGLGTGTLTVKVAVPSPEEARQWLSEEGVLAGRRQGLAGRRQGRRTDLGDGMTQWEFVLEVEDRRLYERGLAYRAGRYVVSLRLQSRQPIKEAKGERLRVAALGTVVPLVEGKWDR